MSRDSLYLITKEPLVPSRSSVETSATARGLPGKIPLLPHSESQSGPGMAGCFVVFHLAGSIAS